MTTTRKTQNYVHTLRREFEIINPYGIHARPARLFVNLAIQYEDTDIRVKRVGAKSSIDGKSIMNLMGLGVDYGSRIELIVSGNGEAEECLKNLGDLIKSGFGEK